MKKFTLIFFFLIQVGHSYSQCTVNAGGDQTVCSNSSVVLTGSYTGATGAVWTSTGAGSFAPNANVVNATYIPSANDIQNGSVKLYLTLQGCTGSDSLLVTIFPGPVIDAGSDQTICADVAGASIQAIFQNASGVTWNTQGTGSFLSTTFANNFYSPSMTDIMNGVVTLTVTTNPGPCGQVSDNVYIAITPAPTVDAGYDLTLCQGVNVDLAGSVQGATGGIWSTSGTGVFSNPTSVTATYYPSAADYASGAVMLTLTSMGNGICSPASDDMTITFYPVPSVEAGTNKALVNSPIALTGVSNGTNGFIWITSGSGTFSPFNALNTTYTPSAADLAEGSVTLTLIANGMCASTDYLVLTNNTQVCNLIINETIVANSVDFNNTWNDDQTSTGAYHWDFGDGTTGWGRYPNHVYASEGTYKVTATYTTPDSSCKATVSKNITITSVAVTSNLLAGRIFAGANPVDSAHVVLFKHENSSWNYYTTRYLRSQDNGYYSFPNLENGKYLVMVHLDYSSAYFYSYQPTYYGNTINSDLAAVIEVNTSAVSGKDIQLASFSSPSPGWNSGSDSISGTITYDVSVALRVTAASINPVANAIVYLYNNQNQLLTYTYTNQFGKYGFGDLAAGTYKLSYEYPTGPAVNPFITVNVDGNPSTISQANNEILKENVTLGINNQKETGKLAIYPNPITGSTLTIQLSSEHNGEASVYVYNTLGIPVSAQKVNIGADGTYDLEVSNLNPGIYTIEWMKEDQLRRTTFIKY